MNVFHTKPPHSTPTYPKCSNLKDPTGNGAVEVIQILSTDDSYSKNFETDGLMIPFFISFSKIFPRHKTWYECKRLSRTVRDYRIQE